MGSVNLINDLSSLRRRVKVLAAVFGAGVVVAACVGMLLGTVLIDWTLNLPAVPRLLLVMGAAGAVVYLTVHWLVRPMMARLSLSDMAGRLERAFPIFDDRLRSTVNFTEKAVPGSAAMQERVAQEAGDLARRVNLKEAVLLRPVWYALGGAAGAALLLVVLVMSNGELAAIAGSRLLHPWDAHPWPKRVQIMAEALPERVPMGKAITVRMTLARGFREGAKAVVHYRYDNGPEQQEYMTAGENKSFSAAIDAKGDKLQVWMESGDDETAPQAILVVPRLDVAAVTAVIRPPKYTGLGPATFNLSGAPAAAVVGSEIELHLKFNKALDAGKPVVLEALSKEMTAPQAVWSRPEVQEAVAIWRAGQSLRFRVHATDTDGFENAAIQEYEIMVRPDQLPTVMIEQPRRNEDHTAQATVPLQVAAEDDFGIKALKLEVERLGDKKHWEIDLSELLRKVDGTMDRVRFRAAYEWELSKLQDAALEPGQVLEYHVEAWDNYELESAGPGGRSETLTHPPAVSGRLRITIVSQDEMTRAATDMLRAAAVKVNDVKNMQVRTHVETGQLQEDTAKKPQLSKADRAAVEGLVNQQGTAAAQTKALGQQVKDVATMLENEKSPAVDLKDLALDVQAQLNRTAENPMKDAATALSDAKEKPGAEARNASLTAGQQNQEEAQRQLDRALAKLGEVGTLSTMIRKWEDNQEKQQELNKDLEKLGRENLGKKPEEMSEKDRAELARIAKEQGELSDKTAQTEEEMEKTAQQMSKSDPSAAEAMQQAGQQAQQQNVSGNQHNAAEQAQQNQQAQAQNAQKQADLGLTIIINTLKEAERRKLAKIMEQLDEASKAMANLIRRQAGHNIDDLTLQGGDQLKLITAELLEKAQRSADAPPPAPEPGQLTSSQEQTERNTRDISKSAGDLPGGDDIVAPLIRAARKMGDAIVELRDRKLAGAYDPNMVEALASLEQAKAKIDQQREMAQRKMEEQEREAIRQVYIKIKQDQDKLNGLVKQLDGAPRGPDGALARPDAIRLGQTPGQQGSLADRTAKLNEDLTALGGVVYLFANKEIVSLMNQVKDDLAKPQTGKPTQIDQERISGQLAAMIADLAIKPPEKQFEQKGGGQGSGSGQGKAKLPTEAELRLLKDMQVALNKSTKEIGDLPKEQRDADKIVQLGGHQGQYRTLLDQLLRQSSGGELSLGPEPPKDQKLPEEATDEQIDDNELDAQLLHDKPSEDKAESDARLIGARMARVRVRLSDDRDPGQTTQKIQKRIEMNIEELITMARQQSQQQMASSQRRPGDKQGQPEPGQGLDPHNAEAGKQGQSQMNHASSPAQSDTVTKADENNAQPGDIKETSSEWASQLPPRDRAAVVEGNSEQIIAKYEKLVQDYYKSLAVKQSQKQQ